MNGKSDTADDASTFSGPFGLQSGSFSLASMQFELPSHFPGQTWSTPTLYASPLGAPAHDTFADGVQRTQYVARLGICWIAQLKARLLITQTTYCDRYERVGYQVQGRSIACRRHTR
jgi:hypothetical protein